MISDKEYCMSSFLSLRTVYDVSKCFFDGISIQFFENNPDRFPVSNSRELEERLRIEVEKACKKGKAALALSGGIDSAILAKYMPKGSVAYTFQCVVPGFSVTDETPIAKKYADECGMEHRVVKIYWEDYLLYAPLLMKRKGAPIHSIEVQIYKAALQAREDGFDTLIFGESADVNYGGQDGLLSRDYTTEEYMDRYTYIKPEMVLNNPVSLYQAFADYSHNGAMDVHEFNRNVYYCESMASYENACAVAKIQFCAPYSKTWMAIPLDYHRVRNGENKYLVREIFQRLYKEFSVPPKLPMPRPMNEWMKDWEGPKRKEFKDSLDMRKFSGDQKWLLFCLENFLNMHDIATESNS